MCKTDEEIIQLARDVSDGMTDKDRVAFGVAVIAGVDGKDKHFWWRMAEDAIIRGRFAFEDEASAELKVIFHPPSNEGEG